ncbi:hypothetical protein PHYSODRAFT_506186, partial [Phytophthora sojae]
HIKTNYFLWKKEQDRQGNGQPLTGEISVGDKCLATCSMLLDCGVTTVYVSKRWVEEHQLQTTKFSDKNIRVKLGDNQIV